MRWKNKNKVILTFKKTEKVVKERKCTYLVQELAILTDNNSENNEYE